MLTLAKKRRKTYRKLKKKTQFDCDVINDREFLYMRIERNVDFGPKVIHESLQFSGYDRIPFFLRRVRKKQNAGGRLSTNQYKRLLIKFIGTEPPSRILLFLNAPQRVSYTHSRSLCTFHFRIVLKSSHE